MLDVTQAVCCQKPHWVSLPLLYVYCVLMQQVRMKANMVVGLVNLLVLNRLTALFEGTPGG